MKKIITLLILLFCQLIFPQSKGSVSGVVTDNKTKEGLPGVNIIVKGTHFGATTDIQGRFNIQNISPGSYTVEVSLIGYKTIQYTGTKITAGKSTVLNVNLDETVLTLEQDIVIIGEKPLVNVEETQSKRSVSREEIELSIVENINDIVTQQAGVVKSDNSIHIRGGRSYENAFLLDGVSVQDPLSGTGFGLQLSANSIEEVEVITGGFNAEFGQATSGIVNVRTREGSINRFHAFLSYKTDNILPISSPFVFNTDIVEFNFSGPEPLTNFVLPAIGLNLPGEVSFFVNGYAGLSDGVTQGYFKVKPRKIYSSIFGGEKFAFRTENNWFWLGKLTYKYSPTMKFAYSYNQSVGINQNSQSLQSNLEYIEPSPGYQYEFQNILDQANVYTHKNNYHTFTLTHTVNSKNYYELKLSHYFTHLRSDANGKKWNEYNEPLDFPNFPIEYYNSTRDTIGMIPGDGFWDVGNPFTWHDHHLEEFSVRGDYTSFFDEKNKFKTGFNLQFQEMQVVDIYKPWVGEYGLNNDIYKVYPALGSVYAQDNINFGGMILNFGLRFDFWFPGKFVDDAVGNPDVITIPDEVREKYRSESYKFFGDRYYKGRLSPRLGISHPISDNQTLFFSYGHFSKWPKPQFVYAKLNPFSAKSSFQKFGNPNLKPETTVAYELGLKTQFTEDDVLTVTAYYKDIFDYVNTRTSRISSARFATQRFITYVNQDYARSRGLEFEYKKRMGRAFSGSASFTYSIVTGKSSSADDGVLVLSGLLDESIKEDYVPWDRPFSASLNLSFYVAKDEALFDFGNGILDDYNVFVRFFFQSGKRYTPSVFTGNYEIDGRPEYETDRTNRFGEIGDNWSWIDLNFEKYIKVGKTSFTLFAEINNLFDWKNSAIINPVTGRAYEFGDDVPTSWNDPRYPDLQAPLNPYPYNPARYLTRRNIRVGVNFKI
ncbi:MAG: TonB-dependent receptor [Ignavibacteriaceae bacterium]|nr:TonB-dependent receptor [Ignavibacteriaceae bacterium]